MYYSYQIWHNLLPPKLQKYFHEIGNIDMYNARSIKSGYMGIAWLQSSADDTPEALLSQYVAMAAEVHCQRPPAGDQ